MSALTVVLQDYEVSDPERRAEYDACLKANLDHPNVTRVLNCCERGYRNPSFAEHPKMRMHPLDHRMTFADAVRVSNAHTAPDSVVVLVNLDIFLTWFGWTDRVDTVLPAQTKIALCLGRHESTVHGRLELEPRLAELVHANAQDAWAWRSPLVVENADFVLGCTGCDNAFADRLRKAGRIPRNYMFTLKVGHLDASARNEPYRRRASNAIEVRPEQQGSYLVPATDAPGGPRRVIDSLVAALEPSIQEDLAMSLYNAFVRIKN
jgi:hypothetical protein